MTLEEMQRALALPHIPDAFPAIYEKLADTCERRAQRILSDDFISQTISECYALAAYREEVLRGAQVLRKNPALCLLVCLLEQWLREGGDPAQSGYVPPKGEGIEFDLLHLYPAIPTMPESVAYLRRRNVPENVIAGTLQEYDRSLADGVLREGRPTMTVRLLSWLQSTVIQNRMINVDRLNFDIPGNFLEDVRVYRNAAGDTAVLADGIQVHSSGRVLGAVGCQDTAESFWACVKETETTVIGHSVTDGLVEKEPVTLDKTKWSLYLCPKDLVPRIHIPREGSFDTQTVQSTIDRARKVFAECYPDYPFKAFFCESWLLSADLRSMLKTDSNILKFQNRFIKVPLKSAGTDILDFVCPSIPIGSKDYQAMPETTGLQRAVKQKYITGGYVYEGAGFFY